MRLGSVLGDGDLRVEPAACVAALSRADALVLPEADVELWSVCGGVGALGLVPADGELRPELAWWSGVWAPGLAAADPWNGAGVSTGVHSSVAVTRPATWSYCIVRVRVAAMYCGSVMERAMSSSWPVPQPTSMRSSRIVQ